MNIQFIEIKNGWHIHRWLSDGDRPVLAVYVNEHDSDHRIWVGDVRASATDEFLAFAQPTKGQAHTHPVLGEEGVRTIVCLPSIVEYVLPRICTVMARVYVPANTVALPEAPEVIL